MTKRLRKKRKLKLKLWLRSTSVPNSGRKLKQQPLNVNGLTVGRVGREKCMHRSSSYSQIRHSCNCTPCIYCLASFWSIGHSYKGRARLHTIVSLAMDWSEVDMCTPACSHCDTVNYSVTMIVYIECTGYVLCRALVLLFFNSLISILSFLPQPPLFSIMLTEFWWEVHF